MSGSKAELLQETVRSPLRPKDAPDLIETQKRPACRVRAGGVEQSSAYPRPRRHTPAPTPSAELGVVETHRGQPTRYASVSLPCGHKDAHAVRGNRADADAPSKHTHHRRAPPEP